MLVSLAGSFDVVLKVGRRVKTIRLDRAHSGVFIATGIWRELRNFSSGAICLALASAPYDEADYIREYDASGGRSTSGKASSDVRDDAWTRRPRSGCVPSQAPGGVNQGPGMKPGAMRRHSFWLRGALHRPSVENT